MNTLNNESSHGSDPCTLEDIRGPNRSHMWGGQEAIQSHDKVTVLIQA